MYKYIYFSLLQAVGTYFDKLLEADDVLAVSIELRRE